MHEPELVAGEIAQLVRRVQAATCLGDRARGHFGRRAHIDQLAERNAGDVLHHHVQGAVLLAEVVHRRDAGVAEPREDRRLVEEHRAHRLGLRVLLADRLDRDELLERTGTATAAEQHRAHAAGLELEQDLVRAEPSDHQPSASLPSVGRSMMPCLYNSSRKCRRDRPACSAAWVTLLAFDANTSAT